MDRETRSLLDEALSWLPDCELNRVEQWTPGCWRFWFDERGSIMTGGTWRIIEDSKLLISSHDHGRKVSHLSDPIDARIPAEKALLTKNVERYTVSDTTLDLSIEFNGGTRLELINVGTIGESWEVTGPSDQKVVAQPNGELTIWLGRSA